MKLLSCLATITMAIAFGGCALRNTQAQPSDRATAQIGIVNHTGNYIYSASVDGAGGGNMARWGEGSANICCTTIPRVWYPSMKVLVRRNMPEGVKDVIKEKVVEVEKYERPGGIYMHFLPNDEVRVVVSRVAPGNPAYPIAIWVIQTDLLLITDINYDYSYPRTGSISSERLLKSSLQECCEIASAACGTTSTQPCSIPVRVGLFFDGTNNNLFRDKNGTRTGLIDPKTKKPGWIRGEKNELSTQLQLSLMIRKILVH